MLRQGIQSQFFNETLRKEGCYFFCLMEIACLVKGDTLFDEAVEQVYHECVEKGWMEEDCFIVNPIEIINHVLSRPRFRTWYKSKTKPSDYAFAVYLKDGKRAHFIVEMQDGTRWDPLDPTRAAAQGYQDDSYCCFA